MLAGQAITQQSPPGDALDLVFFDSYTFGCLLLSLCQLLQMHIRFRQLLEELTELPVMVDLASDFLDRNTPVFRFCIHFEEQKPKMDVKIFFDDYKLPGTMFASSSVSQEKQPTL